MDYWTQKLHFIYSLFAYHTSDFILQHIILLAKVGDLLRSIIVYHTATVCQEKKEKRICSRLPQDDRSPGDP